MPSILFCTPCYGGLVTTAYLQSMMRLQEELILKSVPHDWLFGRNESLVTRARNEMNATFMSTDHTHLFWIDADMEFEPSDVARLWNLQTDIAVGLYSMKRKDQPLSAWKDDKLVVLSECPNEPFEVSYAGTGFMLISREVIETLAKTSESYEGPNGRVAALYMTPIHDDGFESEDYFFCRKAREAGFKVIADPRIRLGHWGQVRYGA